MKIPSLKNEDPKNAADPYCCNTKYVTLHDHSWRVRDMMLDLDFITLLRITFPNTAIYTTPVPFKITRSFRQTRLHFLPSFLKAQHRPLMFSTPCEVKPVGIRCFWEETYCTLLHAADAQMSLLAGSFPPTDDHTRIQTRRQMGQDQKFSILLASQ